MGPALLVVGNRRVGEVCHFAPAGSVETQACLEGVGNLLGFGKFFDPVEDLAVDGQLIFVALARAPGKAAAVGKNLVPAVIAFGFTPAPFVESTVE